MKPISELHKVFADTFDIGMDTDFDSLEYRGIPKWDSAAHMRLIAALENTFDVMFSTDQVLGMSSFIKAKEILASHGIEFGA